MYYETKPILTTEVADMCPVCSTPAETCRRLGFQQGQIFTIEYDARV